MTERGRRDRRVSAARPRVSAADRSAARRAGAYDGGGLAKGGLGTIFVNGQKVAEGRIERTQPMVFSADEGADVGEDGETPVVEDYGIPAPYEFTGTIANVTVDIKPMQAADRAAEGQAAAVAEFRKKAAE